MCATGITVPQMGTNGCFINETYRAQKSSHLLSNIPLLNPLTEYVNGKYTSAAESFPI